MKIKYYYTKETDEDYGTESWYRNKQLHRKEGPAINDFGGYRAWYYEGYRHREDGPAIERPIKTEEWWLHGKQYYIKNSDGSCTINSHDNIDINEVIDNHLKKIREQVKINEGSEVGLQPIKYYHKTN